MALLVAGCVQQVRKPLPPQPVPSASQNQNIAPAPPRSDAIDENDYLDKALEELEAVEGLD